MKQYKFTLFLITFYFIIWISIGGISKDLRIVLCGFIAGLLLVTISSIIEDFILLNMSHKKSTGGKE